MNVPASSRAETLEFVQSMLGQLRRMAEAERCDMLAYLIEMAYIETGDIMRADKAVPYAGGRRAGIA